MTRAAWALVLASTLVPRLAAAQGLSPEALYQAGIEALERREPELARQRFAAAVEATPDARYALALAATLQELGAPTEAIGWYDRLLAGELGPLEEDRRAAITEARAQARALQAELVIRVRGAAEATVELDEADAGVAGANAPLRLRVDAAVHRLRARRGDARSEAVVLEPRTGETREITLDAPPAAAAAPLPPSPVAEAPREVDPAPWIVLGLAALPLGVGVGAGAAFLGAVDQARAAPDHRAAAGFERDAHSFAVVADVSFAVAGALAIVGLVWGLIDLTSGSPTAAERHNAR